MSDKQIQSVTSEIQTLSAQVNEQFITLKMQQRVGASQQELYKHGISIKMDSEGLMEKGKILVERDVQPLLEEKKIKWRTKF